MVTIRTAESKDLEGTSRSADIKYLEILEKRHEEGLERMLKIARKREVAESMLEDADFEEEIKALTRIRKVYNDEYKHVIFNQYFPVLADYCEHRAICVRKGLVQPLYF